jgi:hypothetical protein
VAEGNKDQEVADPNELAYLTLSIVAAYRMPIETSGTKRFGRPEQMGTHSNTSDTPTGVLGGTSGCRGNRAKNRTLRKS